MRVPSYDIKAQYNELKTELDAAAITVLSSGVYTISGGKECGLLEQELADLHGIKHGISVHSGTDALRIMMDAVGIGPGETLQIQMWQPSGVTAPAFEYGLGWWEL